MSHPLYEGVIYDDIEAAQETANSYCKGVDASTNTIKNFFLREYFTVLTGATGYYVTNRFDPRVKQWCEENGVKPRGVE